MKFSLYKSNFFGLLFSLAIHVLFFGVLFFVPFKQNDIFSSSRITTVEIVLRNVTPAVPKKIIREPLSASLASTKRNSFKVSPKSEPQAEINSNDTQGVHEVILSEKSTSENLDKNSLAKLQVSNQIQKLDAQALSPFTSMTVPAKLTGQNLFPRKYRAKFLVDELTIKFIELVPLQEILNYVDAVLEKQFARYLGSVDRMALKKYLVDLQQGVDTEVVIEFKE